MRYDEVPQDNSSIFRGGKKALYALDGSGNYARVQTSGWEAEETATMLAVEEFNRLTLEAKARYEVGTGTMLEWQMYANRMDIPTLSQASGIWQWRIRRHLHPARFSRLSAALKKRYAEALGVDEALFLNS